MCNIKKKQKQKKNIKTCCKWILKNVDLCNYMKNRLQTLNGDNDTTPADSSDSDDVFS